MLLVFIYFAFKSNVELNVFKNLCIFCEPFVHVFGLLHECWSCLSLFLKSPLSDRLQIFFSHSFSASFWEEFNFLKIMLNVLAFPLWISFYILLETNG